MKQDHETEVSNLKDAGFSDFGRFIGVHRSQNLLSMDKENV